MALPISIWQVFGCCLLRGGWVLLPMNGTQNGL
jgi:hypothetical protein